MKLKARKTQPYTEQLSQLLRSQRLALVLLKID